MENVMSQDNQYSSLNRSAFLPTFLRHLVASDLYPSEDRSTQNISSYSLSEDEHKIYFEVPMPGLMNEDINISYDKGVIRVNAEGKRNEETLKRRFYERAHYQYSFHYALPGNIDESKSPKATYDKGILSLVFDKVKKEEPKKIMVQ
jgi:HSP20 family molecular chaperone IbpA